MNQPAPLLEVLSVTKRFPGVTALSNVQLRLARGEVLAVIGENGAGKSTLMKILAGVQKPDEGELRIEGQTVRLDGVDAALKQGIALIHQELNLSDNLSVGANIFLGREPLRRGLIDQQKICDASQEILARVGLQVSADTLVRDLPIGQQQLVEIARALSINARVLIMDEPTSSLSQHETLKLFEVVKDLRARGVSIVYISHRLAEVLELADRVTVMRDGRNAGDLERHEIERERMVRMMVGRDVSQFGLRQPKPPGEVLLEAVDLATPAHPRHPLNFSLRAGEIVGLAGLVGAGRTELLQVLFGIDLPAMGEVKIAGRSARLKSPYEAIERGIALVPEDRKQHGLVLEMSVRENSGLAGLRRFAQKLGFLNREREAADSADMIKRLRVRTPHDRQQVQYLSGGNQQKVVLGKWLTMKPRVLLLDEPTRGIDVGARQEIYGLMEELAAQGMAILFASSEMEEILGMSDRTLVMHEGRITGELSRSELSEEAIMRLATGG